MLLGLLLPSSGTVTVLGEDMIRHRHRVLGRVNFSSPYVDLPRRLTVQQNLRFFARLYGVPDPAGRVRALAQELELTEILKQRSGHLSAGQRTRVSLAKALINTPEVLLLDEPTASLDPDTADWIRGYLEGYQARSGAAILLASHNMAEVERLCDSVLMMRRGSLSTATAARAWSKSSSTSPVTAKMTRRTARRFPRRRPDDGGRDSVRRLGGVARRRHGAAPHLPHAHLLAANLRVDVLADHPDDPLGLHHPVPTHQQLLHRPGDRRADLRRAVVGCVVSWPTRFLAAVFGGDLVAQPCQPVGQPLAPGGVSWWR